MEAKSRFRPIFLTIFLLAYVTSLVTPETLNPSVPKAISDLRDAIVKGLGIQDMKVSGFDVRDALVGQSMAYEFDIEVDNKVIPIKLLEDVSRWDFKDLPIFRVEQEEGEENVVAVKMKDSRISPALPPFQLEGPMELWIQDGDDMRLSLPHDVEAGTLKKVVLSDGAVVTVKGARSVSLRHPLELPLPLNRSHPSNLSRRPVASGLLTLAEALRHASRSPTEHPLLSLRIVGPTSLSSSPSASPKEKLKLKLLAPGLVQLSSRSVLVPAISDGVQSGTFWPLTSLNGSEENLRGFEELLASVLGKKGSEEGSFRLVKAQVSAQTYVKIGFKVEKQLSKGEGDDIDWSKFPEWKTRPEKASSHFEVLARVEEGGKVVPERIAEVQPFEAQEITSQSLMTGNVSMSQVEIVYPPPDYFVL